VSAADKPIFFITGGSRGIGKAVALSAAQAGYRVLFTYLSQKAAADGVVEQIRAQGGEAEALQADTAKESDVEQAFAAADKLGRIEAMVYNTGITGPNSTLANATAETLSRVIEVNLVGALYCARAAVRRMSTKVGGKGGSIVLISSRASVHGSAGEYTWYAASKGGIDSLTVGLAREVATEGIRVNAVSPGMIDTGIHAPGRLERVAHLMPVPTSRSAEDGKRPVQPTRANFWIW
jgi:NAD(P)-dependent dehydrogenase (short-subunit alcohol dehydrogenase family)